MAPEVRALFESGQKKGKYRPFKADVYSLGLVLYFCATGNKQVNGFNQDPNSRERVKKKGNFNRMTE